MSNIIFLEPSQPHMGCSVVPKKQYKRSDVIYLEKYLFNKKIKDENNNTRRKYSITDIEFIRGITLSEITLDLEALERLKGIFDND